MNELDTNIYTHIIIFNDGSKKSIRKDQANIIMNTENEAFDLDGNIYRFVQMAKILTMEEYYQQYPLDKPNKPEEFKNIKTSAYKSLYKSEDFCKSAIKTFSKIIEKRKAADKDCSAIEDLLSHARKKLAGLNFKEPKAEKRYCLCGCGEEVRPHLNYFSTECVMKVKTVSSQ